MSGNARPRTRRRVVLSCFECRRRKQKCSRGNPCMQCIARGPECACVYNQPNLLANAISDRSSHATETLPSERLIHTDDHLRGANEYGYSNSQSLNSMEILTKVVVDIMDVNTSCANTLEIQSRIRSDYYGYVRRIPSKTHCQVLYQYFFTIVNPLNSALDETIFRDQLKCWWDLASVVLLNNGPEKLPRELQCFPALIFQVLALALRGLPDNYDSRLDELRFGPLQAFTDLSKEYTDCGTNLLKLLGKARQTLVGVQYSFLRHCWLVSSGDLMQAWNRSGETVKDAIAIGLHLEPELPPSSQPEKLLNALWMNELRKRTWLNLFVWDSSMALALGRPMFTNQKDCTVTAPIDCNIPMDWLKRVPVARSASDKPTPMTERLLRYKISLRFCEIRELEGEGPIPRNPEKVKELHNFALDFKKSLPSFFQTNNTDKRWDAEFPFVPTHRELLSYLVDQFLMTLHRPYIFTREKSQVQVYKSALAILDSQDRLFENVRRKETPQLLISLTFPTFDAAILLAVVLVSNPERYQSIFPRPYQSLQNALERLEFIGPTLKLAKTGAEILQTTISRVVEAQERIGFPVQDFSEREKSAQGPPAQESRLESSNNSKNVSPDPWEFDPNQASMDWIAQNPDFSDFDFSNLEVPMPLKELLLDEDMATLQAGANPYDNNLWMSGLEQQGMENMAAGQQQMVDSSENELWNFLTGCPPISEDQSPQY